jgi:MraZ protein
LSRTSQPIFAGEFRHALDTKNRVTIPSRWRQGDSDEFFAIPDLDNGCLMVMPPEETLRVAEKVAQDARLRPSEKQKFIRQFFARAQHVFSDKQGRIVLPEEHCRLLQFDTELVLIGNYGRFEIWKPESWKAAFEADSPTFKQVLGLIGL